MSQLDKRLDKLEGNIPIDGKPWIRLITDERKGVTLEDAFKRSGKPGSLEDYRVVNYKIVPSPRRKVEGDFKASLNPEQSN